VLHHLGITHERLCYSGTLQDKEDLAGAVEDRRYNRCEALSELANASRVARVTELRRVCSISSRSLIVALV
jgi:hypothetical protein